MRAAEAARNTQLLLDGTLSRVTDATTEIKAINLGLEDIIESATVMGEKIAAITGASLNHAQSIDQITSAIGQITQVTQQVAAGAEESSASSEELSARAEEMRVIVTDLAGLVSGKRMSAGSAIQSSVRCREVKNCPTARRGNCPAHPGHGNQCWMATGTL